MTSACRRAVRSLRACERLNLIQALSATLHGRRRMADFHRRIAAFCRRDARALATTAR